MHVWSILLRVLLALGLILNGSGYAVASTHMQMDHAALASTTSTTVAKPSMAAEPPCAEHHSGSQSMSAKADAVDTAEHATSGKYGLQSPDCCKSGACKCVCVHQCQATVPAIAFQLAVIENASIVHPMTSGHESAAVPHLIRPPIG